MRIKINSKKIKFEIENNYFPCQAVNDRKLLQFLAPVVPTLYHLKFSVTNLNSP
jgi:hypothetical protein